jgi:hypothetical protein
MKPEQYTDSAEFTDYLYTVAQLITKIEQLTSSDKWQHWMHITDINHDTKTCMLSSTVSLTAEALASAMDNLIAELESI